MMQQLIFRSLAVGAVLVMAARAYSQEPPQLGDDAVRVVNDDETGETECEDSELSQGQCWEFAFKTLQDALDAALDNEEIEEIWVAEHEGAGYVPSAAPSVETVPENQRRRTFQLANDLRVYGGFAGHETERKDRNPELYITVLNGQLDTPTGCPQDDCFSEGVGDCADCNECYQAVVNLFTECQVTWSEDCAEAAFELCPRIYGTYHVVSAVTVDDSATLDGFSIMNGRADGNGYIEFTNNPGYAFSGAEVHGGGIIIDGSAYSQDTAGPTIARTQLIGNKAIAGGGLASFALAPGAICPSLVNLDIRENEALDPGSDGDVTPYPGVGGGAWSGPVSRDLWVNCLLARNTAAGEGGGLFMQTGTEHGITNCTFAFNDAGGTGGGLYLEETGDLYQTKIANSIFSGNSDTNGTDADSQITVIKTGTADVTLSYSDVENAGEQLPTDVIDGGGNIFDDPSFADEQNDDFRLSSGSPCIDVADCPTLPADVADLDEDGDATERTPLDLDVNPRIQLGGGNVGRMVDMGAYEFSGSSDCPQDCGGSYDGGIGIEDFLAVLGQWGNECVSCDFTGDPGVGIDEFLEIIGLWGPCPPNEEPEQESIEDVVTDADLVYPDDWDEFVNAMTDEEEEQSVKDNYMCWMEHYLDCHRSPFCIECYPCVMCPAGDPFGGH